MEPKIVELKAFAVLGLVERFTPEDEDFEGISSATHRTRTRGTRRFCSISRWGKPSPSRSFMKARPRIESLSSHCSGRDDMSDALYARGKRSGWCTASTRPMERG